MAKRGASKYTVDNFLEDMFGDEIPKLSTMLVIDSITDVAQITLTPQETAAKTYFYRLLLELRKTLIRMNSQKMIGLKDATALLKDTRILYTETERAMLFNKMIEAAKKEKLSGMKASNIAAEKNVDKALRKVFGLTIDFRKNDSKNNVSVESVEKKVKNKTVVPSKETAKTSKKRKSPESEGRATKKRKTKNQESCDVDSEGESIPTSQHQLQSSTKKRKRSEGSTNSRKK